MSGEQPQHGGSGDGCGELLVLGLGNVLCADDGVGVRAVERLLSAYTPPPGVRILDGGTLGLALLGWACSAETLILVDAVRGDQPAGTLVELSGDEVAPAVRERLSVHQIGVADLLDGLRLLERCPPRIELLGVVPESLALHVGLSPAVEAALPALVAAVVRRIETLAGRMTPTPRTDRHATPLDAAAARHAAVEL